MNKHRVLVCLRAFCTTAIYGALTLSYSAVALSGEGGMAGHKMAACAESEKTRFINGNILTMDSKNTIVTALEISGNTISALGENINQRPKDSCIKLVDLKGRTMIPGLIDSHVHFLRAGNWPGNRVQGVETASSIAALLELIAQGVSAVPKGEAITIIGGIMPAQFKERRWPTLRELDAVAPDHVVYLQQSFFGPSITNSVGRSFFAGKGLEVAESGKLSEGQETNAAVASLKSTQAIGERERNLKAMMTYANSLGLTTVFDEAGTRFQGASFFDNKQDYKAALKLWRSGETSLRIRSQRLTYDKVDGPGELEAYMDSAWSQFGDDFFKVVALGEHVVSFPSRGKISSAYSSKVLAMASAGWTHEQHSTSHWQNLQHIDAIESAHRVNSISQLRWTLAHVMDLGRDGDMTQIKRLKEMGMGVRVQNQGYHSSGPRGGRNAGPFYRTLLNSGIPVGTGSDGALVGSINPWSSIYYMVTGKNMTGDLVNSGQTLTRLEALRMQTMNNTWFSYEENDLGSLEVGKKADFVVLNEDYLTIPESRIRQIKSVLTFVDGVPVYEEPGTSLLH